MSGFEEKLNAILSDPDAMAQVTFLTTVLSIVTIPLAVSLFV